MRDPARERADSIGPFLYVLNKSMRQTMNIIKRLLLLAPLALAGLDHAPAHAANTARQEHVEGSVAYISGGVSSDEADAMKAAAANYPLTLELAVAGPQRDPYIADARVEIRDLQGNAVLNTTTEGPFLLVRLPSGTYTLDVEWNGAQKKRTVQVAADKRQHIFLEFPRSAER
ncbi:MAG: carboxypeptidase regulatory-like domain-containing protein [Betaproteobacteria bacterium]|nr:MAG: carboxypeptidase regulatory-like domain-containing protein [Betaproteobacteria bacterium]